MPWISLIIWLVTFLLAGGTKSGQAGKAALLATGAAAASYYTIDPANPNAMFKLFGSDTSAATTASNTATVLGSGSSIDASTPTAGPSTISSGISTIGDVLKSWGPSGTVAVVAGTAAATGTGVFSGLKNLPSWVLYAGIGLLAYSMLK
jgi:hypothetical protein